MVDHSRPDICHRWKRDDLLWLGGKETLGGLERWFSPRVLEIGSARWEADKVWEKPSDD
jgi:hypothetical protein